MLPDLIHDLQTTKDQTVIYFTLSADELNKSYAATKWSNREMLHHLTDAESVLYDRIRRGISNPGQVVWGFDQDAWCDQLQYKEMDLGLNKQIYTSVRDGIIELAERFYESHGQNGYVHNETGLRTVQQEFDKVAWHNQHHLKQIEQALAT
ncbi:MAG: DinB family protein [Planctomycetes bacterium]|nr:DinB family protein [Planctomycetota bacterium]